MSIGILGVGVWGSAPVNLLSNNKVTIFARDRKVVDSINNLLERPIIDEF